MAVVSCTLRRTKRPKVSINDRLVGTYTGAEWTIVTDTVMGPRAIYAGATAPSMTPNPLPALWTTYSWNGDTDAASYLRSMEIVPEGQSTTVWRAMATWSPLEDGETSDGSGVQEEQPLSRPLVWTPFQETYTELIEEDKDGNPLLNPAGQPYDPVPEREESRAGVSAVKNYASLSAAFTAARRMSNAINTDVWNGQAARTVLCRTPKVLAPKTDLSQGSAVTYYPVQFDFVFREDGKIWTTKLLQQGTSYLTSSNDLSTRTRADDVVLLNADGTKNTTTSGVYAEFFTYQERDFSVELTIPAPA